MLWVTFDKGGDLRRTSGHLPVPGRLSFGHQANELFLALFLSISFLRHRFLLRLVGFAQTTQQRSLPFLLIEQCFQQLNLLVVRELARLTKNHSTSPTTSTTKDITRDAMLSSPEFINSPISPPQ